MVKSSESLSLESSLQVYFFDKLQAFNKKDLKPLPSEVIYYSSTVMDHFGDANKYFEKIDGKIREKVLGIKLMESSLFPKDKQKVILRDIAETSLLLCGYFSDSLNGKIVNTAYYHEIGVIAYKRLNSFQSKAYDINGFFDHVANNFRQLTNLMSLVANSHENDPQSILLITNVKAV